MICGFKRVEILLLYSYLKKQQMQNLKRIINLNTIFYAVFILLNLIELSWYSNQLSHYYHKIVVHKKISETEVLIQAEVSFHSFLNVASYVLTIVQLFFFNRYVKRNNLGKSYHWLIILVAFIPVVHYFLYYFIWLKLNKLIMHSFGKKSTSSDRKIILIWVLVLVVSIFSLIYPYLSAYIAATQGIFSVSRLIMITVIFNVTVLLMVSIIELFYLVEFRKVLKNAGGELSENQLLDD